MARYHVILLGLLLTGQVQSQTFEDDMGNPLVTQQINAAFTGGQARALRGLDNTSFAVLESFFEVDNTPKNVDALEIYVNGGVWYEIVITLYSSSFPADGSTSFDINGTAEVASIRGTMQAIPFGSQGVVGTQSITSSPHGAFTPPVGRASGVAVASQQIVYHVNAKFYEPGTIGVNSITSSGGGLDLLPGSSISATRLSPLFDK